MHRTCETHQAVEKKLDGKVRSAAPCVAHRGRRNLLRRMTLIEECRRRRRERERRDNGERAGEDGAACIIYAFST